MTALAVARCGVFSGGCEPGVDFAPAMSVKRSAQQGSLPGQALAGLIYPNAIEVTRNPNFGASSSGIEELLRGFRIPGLANPRSLDSDFLKIRTERMNERDLAEPNANGTFAFAPNSPKYSQVLAAYSIRTEMEYLERLGFPFCKSRPLYVFTEVPSDVANALYDHGYLTPSAPRRMRMFGGGPFAAGKDARMYHHELGHMFAECTSKERKIDFAGDNGAAYTEAGALHECIADYVALSFGDRSQLGEWLNRNYDDVRPGAPLRSAVDSAGSRLKFSDVGYGDDARRRFPERYAVSEWCLRTLWDIRSQMVRDRGDVGAVHADYLIYSALSLQQQDTSFLRFGRSLQEADQKLFCGRNAATIRQAFESRDFRLNPPLLLQPLDVSVQPVGVNTSGGSAIQGAPRAGGQLAFAIRLRNTGNGIARNVRVRLTSSSPLLVPTTYMQGYGDIPPGGSVTVGDGGLSLDHSVWAEIDRNAGRGVSMRYAIEALVENGESRRVEGVLGL